MNYLTKSKFKIGLECPNKFYFLKNKHYENQSIDNPFLDALADGGFQVEELARLHYPQGILIEDQKDAPYDHQFKVEQTKALLEANQNIVLFEAAIQFGDWFIRIDILEKKGNTFNLIEVKSKSFNTKDQDRNFLNKSGKISKTWQPYFFDIGFQKYVLQKVYPEHRINCFMMLADKDKKATVNGMNQAFRIKKSSENRTGIEKNEAFINKLQIPEDSVLTKVSVSHIVRYLEETDNKVLKGGTLEELIHVVTMFYKEHGYPKYDLKYSACKSCEFKTSHKDSIKFSGFEYCFIRQRDWTEEDFEKPTAFDIWDFRGVDKLSEIRLELLDDAFLGEEKPLPGKISRVERQRIQKEKAVAQDFEIYCLKDELKEAIDQWQFPLNFIDFEAATVAIPFHKGQMPYDKVVFQFSHHIYHKDGSIEHANEYINVEPGVFPNFEFTRALMSALRQNEGTVFQFSPYENSTLNQVKRQLEESNEPDKETLINFIKTITHPPKKKDYEGERWIPNRPMVDLCRVIKDYYYNPHTKGSNSIKAILPAIFKSSKRIREKYGKPISAIAMSSKNFPKDYVWLRFENDEVVDPYTNLESPFDDWDPDIEKSSDIEFINNGGAAMIAYGYAQYTDLNQAERERLQSGLLKYCELDTLAMVMVYEHLKEITEV